jgi:dTDP-4-dehydrorhamnose 3,5-epimerase
MLFHPTPIGGCWEVELEPRHDERGFFARTFCMKELAARGLETSIIQCNLSHNEALHTLRGMHYEVPPGAGAKLVSCIQGEIYDVVVDLRKESATYRERFAIHLRADSLSALYVATGVAHGFLTLTRRARVFYQMFVAYDSHSSRGVHWNDPALGIDWPHEPRVISERDRALPFLEAS